MYLRNQALVGPWELVKSGTSGALGRRTTPANLARISSRHALEGCWGIQENPSTSKC
jgi:hypothetical protein